MECFIDGVCSFIRSQCLISFFFSFDSRSNLAALYIQDNILYQLFSVLAALAVTV